MAPAFPEVVACRRTAAGKSLSWSDGLLLSAGALLAAAAPAARLELDEAVLLEGACLAPAYAGSNCLFMRPRKGADQPRLSASEAVSGAEDRTVLAVEIDELVRQGSEVTFDTVRPPQKRDLRGRRRP
jgi:hypothetical protein